MPLSGRHTLLRPYEDTVFYISVINLTSWLDCPKLSIKLKQLSSALAGATLSRDLIRLALRLWLAGIPTCRFFPARPNVIPSPVLSRHFLERTKQGGSESLKTKAFDWGLVSVHSDN